MVKLYVAKDIRLDNELYSICKDVLNVSFEKYKLGDDKYYIHCVDDDKDGLMRIFCRGLDSVVGEECIIGLWYDIIKNGLVYTLDIIDGRLPDGRFEHTEIDRGEILF